MNVKPDINNTITEKLQRALLCLKQKKLEEAESIFCELNNQNLVIEENLFDIAALAVKLGKNNEAIQWYKKIINHIQSDRQYLACHALGNIYRNLENLPEASL